MADLDKKLLKAHKNKWLEFFLSWRWSLKVELVDNQVMETKFGWKISYLCSWCCADLHTELIKSSQVEFQGNVKYLNDCQKLLIKPNRLVHDSLHWDYSTQETENTHLYLSN